MSSKRIIRPHEAWAMAGFSRSTAYRLEAEGRFPSQDRAARHRLPVERSRSLD
ncbi:helix-turn-helix transcriptional regulator [Lysobacter niastensis]|uniref:helix-turn-helix transcriptional regulator n=1 Tax=Lysobacter niastensis TaxID=380629 RepID=UPI003D2F5DCC